MEEENPYIPKFISDAPWYADKDGGRLDHQKDKREKVETGWYDRGEKRKAPPPAKKYRKGACTNCGSMSHKTSNCFERPRKRGAKLTNMNIRADDELEHIHTTYDSKRDAWNGYRAEDYKEVIEKYEEEERARKEREKENGVSDDDDVDKEKDLPASERSRSMRTMDDKAQYLKNLDADDYNPRLRMMKEVEERLSTSSKNGTKGSTDLAVNPTAYALKNRTDTDTMQPETSSEFKKTLLEKYGTTPAKPAALAPRIVSEQQQQPGDDSSATADNGGKSKYPEDVFPGNHTSVWGSYWKDGVWGYKCCKSSIKNSYCMAD